MYAKKLAELLNCYQGQLTVAEGHHNRDEAKQQFKEYTVLLCIIVNTQKLQ